MEDVDDHPWWCWDEIMRWCNRPFRQSGRIMVQAGSGNGGAVQSVSACRVESDGVAQEEDDGEVRLGGYEEYMVKDLGMGMDTAAKRMKRMTMMQFIRKQVAWVLDFLECFSSVSRNGE